MPARLEIFIAAAAQVAVEQVLDACQAPGYSVIAGVTGRGRHGHRYDDLIEASACVCVVCVCELPQAQKIADALAPVITTYGGICSIQRCEAP